MADVSIAIYGLGRVGTSIGLALKRYNANHKDHAFTISGYDITSGNLKTAQKMNAIDKSSTRPEDIAAHQDMIVIAMPYSEVEAVYELINRDLRPGTVVIDLSTRKQKSIDWAQKNFSEEIHLICAAPIVNSKYLFEGADETARATDDLFDNGTFLIMPSIQAMKEAISLVSHFANVLGATPMFFDAAEYDALVASTEILPTLFGTVFFDMLTKSSGWNDAQRVTNSAMGMLSHHLFDTHPDDLRDMWLDSSDDLVHCVDEIIRRLHEYRTIIANKDRSAIEAALEQASKEYEVWINRRYNNRWQADERMDQSTLSFGSMIGNMFGGMIGGRKQDEN